MKMSQRSRQEYLERIRVRYQRAGRKYKKIILDEFCEVCGYERKYAIKLVNRPPGPRKRPPGPKPRYGEQELRVLKRIWKHSEQICSKRLKAALSLWLPFYEKHYERIAPKVRRNLKAISPATIDRLLASVRAHIAGRGRSGTRPGTLIRTQIPIRIHHWDVTEPGFLEADSVAHCGESMAGNFIWSITYTDILSGWTVCRAVWNRGAQGVLQQTRDVEQRLPFPVQGFDCDNGGEFLNWHLIRYFTERKQPVQFTRGRPYHKDDNAHVEQKNWTHVRQLLGYERFDDAVLLGPINDLYRHEWELLHNFFCPSTKLIQKQRVKSRYVKKHDPPQTPCQRLLQWDGLTQEAEQKLKATYKHLDPFELAAAIEQKLRHIFDLHHKSKLGKAS